MPHLEILNTFFAGKNTFSFWSSIMSLKCFQCDESHYLPEDPFTLLDSPFYRLGYTICEKGGICVYAENFETIFVGNLRWSSVMFLEKFLLSLKSSWRLVYRAWFPLLQIELPNQYKGECASNLGFLALFSRKASSDLEWFCLTGSPCD